MDGDAPEPPEKRQKAQTEQPGDDEEKVVKTDKVILGDKVSWAVQEVLGEDNVDVRRSLVDDAKAKKNAVSAQSGLISRSTCWIMGNIGPAVNEHS